MHNDPSNQHIPNPYNLPLTPMEKAYWEQIAKQRADLEARASQVRAERIWQKVEGRVRPRRSEQQEPGLFYATIEELTQ